MFYARKGRCDNLQTLDMVIYRNGQINLKIWNTVILALL